MRIQSKYLDEKLTAADPTSKWISDFVASDNPRFANKSKKERINMALGASYAAKGQSNNEETYSDTGWTKSRERKDPQGNVIKTKNVASKLAKQGMQQAKAGTSSEKGFGPSPADKLSIRKNEEAELGEELSSSQRDTHFSLMNKHGVLAKSAKGPNKDAHRMAALDHQMALRNPENSQSRSKSLSLSNKLGVKEDVELDEAINHLQMAKHHQALAKEHDRISDAANRRDEPELSDAHGHQSDDHQDAAKAHLQAHKTGNPKDVAAAKKATRRSLQTGSTPGGSIYHVGKYGDDSHEDYNYSKLRSGADAIKKGLKEEVELDEGKYGAFRVGPRRPKYPHVPQGNQDPRTGLPLGFSPPPNKDEPKDKKVKEEVELDELDQSTLTKYATRAKFSSDPKRRAGAEKAQEKINKKSKDMQKEEAEQVDEVLDSAGKVMSYATKATVSGLKSAITGTGKFRKRQAGIQTALRKTKEKIANEEVDESIGSTVGGLVGQYAGSKLGMEGPGRAHGELAGRAIEYHVRKFANRLKKKITGKNESVEVEEDNKAYRAQDKASRETTGMSLPQRSKMYDDIQKKLKDQEEEYRKQGILPPKNEEVELEEDGKLKGGAKDPCWKGYQMVGTKKKNGREVPNCVPREGKEYKSFKALREELNGDK